MACTVAPRRLSKREPISPPSRPSRAPSHQPRSAVPSPATSPMSNPPAAETAVPSGDTPPDVPRSTTLKLVMRRGGRCDSVPNSVAHVSALTVAMMPTKRGNHAGWGKRPLSRATSAPGPPLAIAWPKSRRCPLSNLSAATCRLRSSLKWESKLELKKKMASNTPHSQPPIPNVSVPTSTAPTTPERAREPRQ